MQAGYILRIGSIDLSAIMGGMAVFDLYFAGQLSDHKVVWYLFGNALMWGGLASAIVYLQRKYLDR